MQVLTAPPTNTILFYTTFSSFIFELGILSMGLAHAISESSISVVISLLVHEIHISTFSKKINVFILCRFFLFSVFAFFKCSKIVLSWHVANFLNIHGENILPLRNVYHVLTGLYMFLMLATLIKKRNAIGELKSANKRLWKLLACLV